MGDHRRRGRGAGGRTRAGVGSAGQGMDEPVLRRLVVGAGRRRRRAGVDAQLRPDSAHAAEVGRGASQAMAFGGGVLRRQCAVHHDARRPGVVGHVHLPPATDLGRVAGGGIVAAGDVGRTAGGGPCVAWSRRCVPAGREQEPVVADLHTRRLRRVVATGAGGGNPAGTHRRHRRAGAVVGELSACQAVGKRPGQMARDAGSTRIGQPDPAPAGRGS